MSNGPWLTHFHSCLSFEKGGITRVKFGAIVSLKMSATMAINIVCLPQFLSELVGIANDETFWLRTIILSLTLTSHIHIFKSIIVLGIWARISCVNVFEKVCVLWCAYISCASPFHFRYIFSGLLWLLLSACSECNEKYTDENQCL